MNKLSVYPYVVPEVYLSHVDSGSDGFVVPLGHRVYAMLYEEYDGVSRSIRPDELELAGNTPEEMHQIALDNLETLAEGPAIRKSTHRGPDGIVFMHWSGHWLTASCIRLAGLLASCRKHLEVESVCVSIPQRESMLLFPFGTRSQRNEMRAMIQRNEQHARKLVTWELFSLTPSGLQPFQELDERDN